MKTKKTENLEAVHTHTPVSYKQESKRKATNKPRTIEFNLSKVVTTLVQTEENKKSEVF